MPEPIPTWLDAPPEGTVPPPADTKLQHLPFEQLGWADFERLIVRLIRQLTPSTQALTYGNRGQAQDGIDILAVDQSTDHVVCYQCKHISTATRSLVSQVVEKFLQGKWAERTSQFVLCVSVPMTNTKITHEFSAQLQRLRASGVDFQLWEASPSGQLVELLKEHPVIVDDFFGRAWVERFNGQESALELDDRLDAVDASRLRRRLHDLYTVVFEQHDPGPPKPPGRRKLSYLQRYVPVDVSERGLQKPTDPTNLPVKEAGFDDLRQRPDYTMPYGTSSEAKYEVAGDGASHSNPPGTDGSGGPPLAVFDWLSDNHKSLVLGDAGSGKSTLLRFLALYLVSTNTEVRPTLLPKALRTFPVWMSFARFSAAVRDTPHVSVEDYFGRWLHEHGYDDVAPLFARALRHSEAFLLVDGLDEAVNTQHGREALNRIVAFSRAVDAMIVCSSRPAALPRFAIPDWNCATIAPLRDTQIHDLAKRWFLATEFREQGDAGTSAASIQADSRATRFLRAVKATARTATLARNPMLCSAMTQLFQSKHRLPVARAKIYDDIVDLLLSRHPAARAHAAMSKTPAETLDLSSQDLRELLVRLASAIHRQSDFDAQQRSKCHQICRDLLKDETEGLGVPASAAAELARSALDLLTDDLGVLVEKGPNLVGFVHLSIQEYLAADQVTRLPDEAQLEWLAEVWQLRKWRESIADWFAIQGMRGNLRLTALAADRLAELGKTGEWQRLQSIELRVELASADSGFPVGLARTVIREGATSVATSPFSSHRMAIARSITLGATSPRLRDTCADWVQHWLPGRPATQRASLLRSFDTWAAAEDLRATLSDALQDDDHACRTAASHSLLSVFGSDTQLCNTLQQFAEGHVRPEVRAVALRTLADNPRWRDATARACDANTLTASDELAFSVVFARVKNHQHSEEDLGRLSRVWSNHSVDFNLREEIVDTLCAGWPQHRRIRDTFVSFLEAQQGTLYYGIPVCYLVRCYPQDDEIASLMVRLLDAHGLHIGFHSSHWSALIDGYRGHPAVSSAIRGAIDAYKADHGPIVWHPYTLPAFAVIGDDAARDELIQAYAAADNDDWDRHWIAHTLMAYWPRDRQVVDAIQAWAALGVEFSAPLAKWAKKLYGEPARRKDWLMGLVDGASPRLVVLPIGELLQESPDDDARAHVERRACDDKIWYYHQVRIRAMLARFFPTDTASEATVRSALSEIDGPPLAEMSVSYESHACFRPQFLRASIAAPDDVRQTVAATLRDHVSELEAVEALSPGAFAESSPSVRTTLLVARARAARDRPGVVKALARSLREELSSLGTFYRMRRIAALAGLLDAGCANAAVAELSNNRRADLIGHLNPLEDYSTPIAVIVEHWPTLRPLMEHAGLAAELPIEDLLTAGYGSLVARSSEAQPALDQYLHTAGGSTPSRQLLQHLAQRFPRSDRLRDELFATLDRHSHDRSMDCYVAQLLIDHFKEDLDTMTNAANLLHESPSIPYGRLSPGAVSLLRFHWPDELRHCKPQRPDAKDVFWTDHDRLLDALAEGDGEASQRLARALVLDTARDWRYRRDDLQGLRLWAQQPSAREVLESWCESTNGTLAVSGLALSDTWTLASRDRVINPMMSRLAASLDTPGMPRDGLDVTTGQVVGWDVKALEVAHANFN